MATATRKSSSPPPRKPDRDAGEPRRDPWILRAFDAAFRFLASLKLAVISLLSLASILAYATFFESWYGTSAVQEQIYKSPMFALVLAMLGMNILCAALIRFPWKKRQIGFVITHAGLLIVLAGSWISFMATDDGQVGAEEGQSTSELVRIDHTAVRVQTIDPHTGHPSQEYQLPFHPGAFPWDSAAKAQAVSRGVTLSSPWMHALAALILISLATLVASWIVRAVKRSEETPSRRFSPVMGVVAACLLVLAFVVVVSAGLGSQGPRYEVLTDSSQPFKFAVKDYFPASTPYLYAADPGEDGSPMVKAAFLVRPPNAKEDMDALAMRDDGTGRARWLKVENPRVQRVSRDLGPALMSFQYVDNPDKVEDFLALPDDPLKSELVRIHYTDNAGKGRVYEWNVTDIKPGEKVTLPDSDLTVTFEKKAVVPVGLDVDPSGSMAQAAGSDEIRVINFQVKKGDGPEVEHFGWGSLPMIPSRIPSREDPKAEELVRISYFYPPAIAADRQSGGHLAVIEILGTPEGKLYYRALNRDGLKGKGPLKAEETVRLVGGPNQPMGLAFRVDQYLVSGVDREYCEALVMPKGKMGEGIPAALAELTVDGHTEEFWVRRSPDLEPAFRDVDFPDGRRFRVALDFDRKDLGFNVKLVNFEKGNNPGTDQAASFQSDVLLSDPSDGIKDEPVKIWMNHPLMHNGYTLYQANYIDKGNGQFVSVWQTRYDPVWGITYTGALLVVVGAFIQFFLGPLVRLVKRVFRFLTAIRPGDVANWVDQRRQARTNSSGSPVASRPRPAAAETEPEFEPL